MSKTTEQTISVLIPKGASNIRVEILEEEGKVDITFNSSIITECHKKVTKEYLDEYFPVVKASTLSLEDEFLKHEPESDGQTKFKEMLTEAIKSGLSDFRAQRMDATLDEYDRIYYQKGKKPEFNKSANWWKKNAKKFMPEKESRLGTIKERIAFLGLLIKYLIEERGYIVSDAWKAVCDQSKDLGHYRDSKDAKNKFEFTGSRQVGDWYDLANTSKIIINDDEASGFSLIGGDFYNYGEDYPLADVNSIYGSFVDYSYSTGWIVLSV